MQFILSILILFALLQVLDASTKGKSGSTGAVQHENTGRRRMQAQIQAGAEAKAQTPTHEIEAPHAPVDADNMQNPDAQTHTQEPTENIIDVQPKLQTPMSFIDWAERNPYTEAVREYLENSWEVLDACVEAGWKVPAYLACLGCTIYCTCAYRNQ